jgi:UDPglucose--hexose-1-phosphate uridylyltransferase
MVFSWVCKNVVLSDSSEDPLFQSAQATGTCKVMCFHPWSDMTLPLMEVKAIVSVIEKWAETYSDLGKTYTWVQVSTCKI